MMFKRLVQSGLTLVLLGLALVVQQEPAHAAGTVYGPYYLMNVGAADAGNLQCLADPGASTANNVQQILWNCGSSGQKFSNETAVTTTDYWTFNYANGRCLAPLNASRASGAAIVQTACTTATSGRWAYHYVGDGSLTVADFGGQLRASTLVFTIQNLNSGLCISAKNGGSIAGTQLVQVACSSAAADKWVQFPA
ncbi:RICIN domain-containing protein [Dactylosporangium matsuzakiense]|uniref:Ricin-type beta-trefoil lectin protein n=1 Tax=Dactylosporangium matsuzakiense TaxID=53360 RepID=A0A9W6NQ13_9ACTN|nr:RICIN domain-containing protein [Dactylosporangium matsuzakiense]GLL04617.1 hypothetical protein GCM10017581_063640 [Dactylosporangium matsuzakiense]